MEVPLQICRKNETAIDTTDVFTTSQRFVTREEVIRWVKETGINNKVTVIIARSDTETGKRGRSNKVIFACDKGGKYKDKSETQSATKRCGCPFKIRSTPAKDGSGWKVDVKCGVHNHGLPDRLEGHSFVGRLTTNEKQHVADLTKRHVPPRHISISLQERDPENVTRITQIYKHKSVIEAEIRGPRSEIQHLLKVIEEANYVYWSRKQDDCDVVRDVFWAHPDSVKLLNLFPTVLIMDATYKTNKYRQPLFEIVGMTSTELTFAVAFAYMECEQTESYIWVLDKLKQLFVKKDVVPQVILTDRDLALMKAVEVVFPTMHNLLCRFHINKNVGMKCKEYVMKDMQETIGTLWKDVVWASNEVEYGVRLQYLEQACFACTDFLDYVKNTWLIPHRQRFVGAWINLVLHFGNTTTNRVESAHWKLKQMIGNSLGDMVKVWEAMNSNLKIQIVSRAALRRIAEELLRLDYVLNSREKCGCTMRTSYGLPCACEMGRSIVVGIPLQIENVHLQWRILSMEGDLPLDEEAGSEVDMSNAIDELWIRFKSLDVVGKRALKSRVCEIAYPTTTSLCPPPEKIKTKGGVKRKGKKPVGYDVYRDPSGFEYADQASQSSQKQSQASQTSRKQSQSKKQSQAKDEDFTLQFPCHIRPYITEIVNVVADGNCGFRAIASWHGYSEDGWAMVRRDLDMELREKKDLYERLFGLSLSEVRNGLLIDHVGFQPPEKWLTLPEMGYLIANRYNIILVLLGNPCLTFFPMTTTFSPSAPTYCIGLVNRNQFLRVNMKEGFPLPPVTLDWMKFRHQVATSWMLGFAGRLQHWHHLTPMLPSRVNID
ncbi:PKS-NRPS hybrid synthetase cheA-like [Vicia villosa]|uniref:PKS-NRPS hybrid synthetase cheA-like n=1 Tax=Vicia villosa TaxID=3911 RepID=UPI00273BBE9E|nr:PKS-NRPS hybrid synthetase cheA-like [Vicia villosa]